MVVGIDSGFLSRQYAGVPMWGWIVGGVGLLVGVTKLRGSNTPAAGPPTSPGATSAAEGGGDPGNIFFLPQQGYPNPQSVSVNVNPRPIGLAARLKADPNEGPKLKDQSKIIALAGETWEDVTARAYGYADSFADSKTADQQRIRDVAGALKRINGGTSAGPPAGQAIYFN